MIFGFRAGMWKPARRYARFVLLIEILSSLYHCAGACLFRVTVSRYLVRILYQRPRRSGKKPKAGAGGMFRKKKPASRARTKKGRLSPSPAFIYILPAKRQKASAFGLWRSSRMSIMTRSTVFMPSRETRPTFATVSSIEAPKTPCGTVRRCPSSAHSIAQ